MARWVGRLLLLGVALAAAALVGLVAATRHIDPDRLADFVSRWVRMATGREFAVAGGLRVRILPHVAIVADDVRLGNVSWGSRRDMLQVRRVEGSIPLLPLFRGEIQVDRLVFVEPELFLETDPAGMGNWAFGGSGSPTPGGVSATGGRSPLSLRLSSLAIEKGSVVNRNGRTGEETRLSLDRLTVARPPSAATNALDLAGSYQERPFTLSGQVSALEAFLFRGNPLDINVALATAGATATLAGRLDRSGGGPLLEGMLKVHAAGSPDQAKPVGAPVTAPVPLDLAGKLTVDRNTYRLEDLEVAYGPGTASGSLVVRLDSPQPDLTAAFSATWRTAKIGKEVRLSVDSLTLKRNVSTATNVLELAGALQGQPLTVTGIVGPLGAFFARRSPLALDLALATEGAKATLAGKIGREDGGLRTDLAVQAHIESISALEKLAGGPVTMPAPLDLAGRLAVEGKTWRVDGLTIATAQSTVSGNLALQLGTLAPELTAVLSAGWRTGEAGEEVRLTLDRLGLKRSASSGSDSLDLAGSLRGQPFTLTGRVGAVERFLAGRDPLAVDLVFATDGAMVALAGRIDRDRGRAFPDVTVKAHVEGTAGLAQLAGRPLTLPVPLDVAGRVTVREKTWRVDGLKIASGRSQASGGAVVRLDSPRPELTASIDAPLIDLPELFGWKRDRQDAAAVRGRRLFSETPLPFEGLRGLDGRLELKAARLRLADWLQLESAHLDLGLRGGRLLIDPLRFVIAGGAVAGTAQVDATPGRTPRVLLSLAGSGISLERWVADAGFPQGVTGGSVDLGVHLSGSGASARSVMSGLNGELRLSSGPARLTTLALAPGDILTGILGAINPFRGKDRFTELTCAVVRLPVRDGLVTIDRTVAYETEKVASAVAGTIALDSEALDLAIKPTVKSGFGLVGAPGQAEFVRIAGTLAQPKLELSTLATARTALSAGSAVATGGLSLLGEALFKKAASDAHPCKTALERKVPDKRAAARPVPDPAP